MKAVIPVFSNCETSEASDMLWMIIEDIKRDYFSKGLKQFEVTIKVREVNANPKRSK